MNEEIFFMIVAGVLLLLFICDRVRNDKRIDFKKDRFYLNRLDQWGYDREIDEGFGSGFRRYATLDVSDMDENIIKGLLYELELEFNDFNVVKCIQISGFNKGDKIYIAISGVSHMFYEGMAQDCVLGRLDKLPEEFKPLKIEDKFIPLLSDNRRG